MQAFITGLINSLFVAVLFINSLLFIPQSWKLYKTKDASQLSAITFLGFSFLNIVAVSYGILHKDYLMVTGYSFAFITCGITTLLILKYKKSNSTPIEAKHAEARGPNKIKASATSLGDVYSKKMAHAKVAGKI